MHINKARITLALSTKTKDIAFYSPGERSQGPLGVFSCIENGTGQKAILSTYQVINGVKRFLRQGEVALVSQETIDADGGGLTTAGGTAANPIQPNSVIIKTQDNSGFLSESQLAYVDDGNGKIVNQNGVARGTVNYFTGVVALTFPAAVTSGQAVYIKYAPAKILVEGMKVFQLDGYTPLQKINFQGICDAKTQFGWLDVVGHWL